VAVAGAHAIAAGVAAADHDDMLAIGTQLALDLVARVDLVLLGQEFHREVDAVQVAAGHGQVARLLGAAGQQHGVKIFLQLLGRDGFLGPVGDLGVLAQPSLAAPTSTPVRKVTPSACICSTRRSMCDFSSLKSGMP
jgi:hypothetical protein